MKNVICFLAAALGFMAVSTTLAELKVAVLEVLAAEAGDPAVPEFMGGCSMKCTFPWTVTAQKKGKGAPSPVKALNDERADTPWTDASGGVGARLTFHFSEKIPAEMEGKVPFYGIEFINRDARSASAWKNCAHIKKARLFYNGRAFYDIVFPDIIRRWSTVSFGDFMVRSGDTVTLESLEIYSGSGVRHLPFPR